MKHKSIPLEIVNALVTIPSTAFEIEAYPELAILCLQTHSGDWGMELESLISGCIVLGYKKIILDLKDADISTSFQIACIISAWHLLIEVEGTLLICGLTEQARKGLQKLSEPKLFNVFTDMDEGVDWLDSTFEKELKQNFPRTAECKGCGTEGDVSERGDYVCDRCGKTYLVTERGELLF
jgi:anti-anti-sigma regulatory factor